MRNPDRVELRLDSDLVSESPKQKGHIPRWLSVSTFAFRTSLAILTAAPGTVVATDAINRTERSSMVYGYDQKVTVDPPYNFDQLQLVASTPIPTETAQSPVVHKVKVCMNTYDKVCTGDFPYLNGYIFTESRGGNTGINLKAGQTLEISATGRVLLQDQWYQDRYATSCRRSALIDPDGNRHLGDTVCSPAGASDPGGGSLFKEVPIGSLIGSIYIDRGSTMFSSGPYFLVGSHWEGGIGRDGRLHLAVNYGTLHATSGGFDVTVTVYPPPLPTPTIAPPPRPAPTPEPIRTTTPTEKGSGLPGWLLGAGAAFLTALAADRFYRRRKVGKGAATVPTTGTAGGTSPSATPIPRIRGVAGAIGAGPNPNVAPNFGPAQQKNPEWIVGQQDFERRWQAAKSKLSPKQPGETGNEPGYVLERFKGAMCIVHEVSLDNKLQVPRMAVRVRAGIEYLIPEIWPDSRIIRRFFDPNFNAGYLTEEDLAKIIYLPEQYRTLSKFNATQGKDITRIHRILIHALHPDTSKSDADPNLKDAVDDLLKGFNPAWSYIENLIK